MKEKKASVKILREIILKHLSILYNIKIKNTNAYKENISKII